ncbi:MAG: phage scaffolding protein [Bacteroidaceae bacterium]
MKRSELEKIGLTKEQMDAVMEANGSDIEEAKKDAAGKDAQISTLTQENTSKQTQIDDLNGQIKQRDTDIKNLQKTSSGNEDLQKQITDLQTRYDGDTKALNEKLQQQRYDHAAEKMFVGVEFASKLARTAAVADFKSKGYKLNDDGKSFVGADGYIDALKKDDPAAFVQPKEDDSEGNGDKKPPAFTKKIQGGEGVAEPPMFQGLSRFNLVRPMPTENK